MPKKYLDGVLLVERCAKAMDYHRFFVGISDEEQRRFKHDFWPSL